jgi:hypothetical protein
MEYLHDLQKASHMSFTIWTCGWWQLAKEGIEFSCEALEGNP